MDSFDHKMSDGVVIAVTNIQLCLAQDSVPPGAELCSEDISEMGIKLGYNVVKVTDYFVSL